MEFDRAKIKVIKAGLATVIMITVGDYCSVTPGVLQPIIFGRPFLKSCGAIIDCKKGKVSVEFNGDPYEFNFSKLFKQPRGTDLPSNDKIIEEIASISIPPNDPLQ